MKAPLTTDGNTTTHLALSRSPWGMLSGMFIISVITFPAFSTRSFSFLSSALAEDTRNTAIARKMENPFILPSFGPARATPTYASAPLQATGGAGALSGVAAPGLSLVSEPASAGFDDFRDGGRGRRRLCAGGRRSLTYRHQRKHNIEHAIPPNPLHDSCPGWLAPSSSCFGTERL